MLYIYILYMVTFTINIPQMLAYIPYMDPMGTGSIHFWFSIVYHAWTPKNGSNLHPCYDPPRLSSGRRRRRTRRWGEVNWGWEESLAPSPTDPHDGRNPNHQLIGGLFIPWFIGFQPSKVVQNFWTIRSRIKYPNRNLDGMQLIFSWLWPQN